MSVQHLALVLTAANLVILGYQLVPKEPATAQGALPVLRGRALEIVDEQGQIRASIAVYPPTTVDGKQYPETVLLRLRDPKLGPM